jgi:hypothetical protein
MDEILKDYFVKGFSYQKILQFHGINISMRALQRRLYNLGLKRTNIDYNREDVRAAIVSYCNGAGSSGGYRSVWHALRLRGLVVPDDLSQKYIGKLTILVQSKEEITDCKDGDTLTLGQILHGMLMGMTS